MANIVGFVISSTEPQQSNVGWMKPVQGGYVQYVMINGAWRPIKLVDDKGTPSPYDDEPIDSSGGSGGSGGEDIESISNDDIDNLLNN